MDLKSLIAASHGSAAAEAWASFVPSEDQLAAVADAGHELLRNFPQVPGACVMMSTLCACKLEKRGLPPAYVVAGSLYVIGPRFVGDTRVFGEAGKYDGQLKFSVSHPSWDGHAWIVFGDRLVDVSVFRTAYSRFSPPVLASHVKKEFGEGGEMLISPIERTASAGLRYEAEYVLTQDQVDGNARGAIAKAEELLSA